MLIIYAHCYGSPHRLLIDSDVGLGKLYEPTKGIPADIDDAYAIVNALRSQQLKVAGITTVFGNTQLEAANHSLKTILELSGNEHIPWKSGATRASQSQEICPVGAKDAADFIAAQLSHSPAYILAIGPLTNIACLLMTHTEIASQIKEILVVMGQSVNTEFSINQVSVQDLNFESDVHAVKTVLNSKVPVSFFPFELTRVSLVQRKNLDNLPNQDQLVKFFKNSSINFIGHWNKLFSEDGFHPWDSAPVAYLKNPAWFKCEKRQMSLEYDHKTVKLIAKHSKDKKSHWSFCHSFTSKTSQKTFEDDVLNQIIQKPSQS